jgi:hypothetical protein
VSPFAPIKTYRSSFIFCGIFNGCHAHWRHSRYCNLIIQNGRNLICRIAGKNFWGSWMTYVISTTFANIQELVQIIDIYQYQMTPNEKIEFDRQQVDLIKKNGVI